MTSTPSRPLPSSPLRIGGASGFWGDSSLGAPQLVNSGLIDVLVFDYLAETTMAILAAAQRKNPDAGYATDFVDPVMRQVLPEVVKRGIKVVANAGGINPQGCARPRPAVSCPTWWAPRPCPGNCSAPMPTWAPSRWRAPWPPAPMW